MRFCLLLSIGLVTAVLAGCSPVAEPEAAKISTSGPNGKADDALVQFSLIAALADGDYAEGAPLRQVLAGGDFGIGTFDRLDGEMIVLDGKMYQALADGSVRPANLDGTTPFAAVTYFAADGTIKDLSAETLEHLDAQLDDALPRRNVPYAIRVDAEFLALTLRSVPAQSPPFSPLVEVVKHQATWKLSNVRGSLVGIRCPAWVGTLNVSGYHWHFVSDDRGQGGHVLTCEFSGGLLRFDECKALVINLPQSTEFDKFDADKIKHGDIDQIERQRSPMDRQ